MIQLAGQYGLSDRGLAKICKKINVPVPPRGYWATTRSGIKLKRPALPKLRKGDPESHTLTSYRQQSRESEKLENFSEKAKNLFALVLDAAPIKVSARLNSPHPLFLKTQKHLGRQKPKDYPLISPTIKGCVDIKVAPENLQRALGIVDAVIQGFIANGFKIGRDPARGSKVYVSIFGEKIYFAMNEKVNRSERKPSREEQKEYERYPWPMAKKYDFSATGIFALLIENSGGSGLRKKWADGKTKKVEDKLTDFLLGAIKVADRQIKERIEVEESKLRREEARRREEEERWRREIERKRLQELEDQAVLWEKSQQLRDFIRAVQEEASKRPCAKDLQEKLMEWVSWAQRHADRLDPIVPKLPFEPLGERLFRRICG